MKGSVQSKISCLFKTVMKEEPSSKRTGQLYRVVASETVLEDANLTGAIASEKIDGTCCYVGDYRDKPWIWARFDKKPSKAAERRFRMFQNTERTWIQKGCQGARPRFDWDVERDFKATPNEWVPAKGVTLRGGSPLPDRNGHIPGWVPLDTMNKAQCWHNAAVSLSAGVAAVLSQSEKDENCLCISLVPLEELSERTLELIGTNVNGNPYGIGNKKHPVHLYVPHGDITLPTPPSIVYHELKNWFSNNPQGSIEGIVWHCQDGTLYKIHRHHLGLKWPLDEPHLTSLPVNFDISSVNYGPDIMQCKTMINILHLNGQRYERLRDVSWVTEND